MLISAQDESLRTNPTWKEGFRLLILFQRPEGGIWIQNRKRVGPPGPCRTWSLTITCTSLMRKQAQKGTAMIFKELSLHEKGRLHTFSSLSLARLPQILHPLAKLFTNPSTNLEFFPAFAQAPHLPHQWFSSKPMPTYGTFKEHLLK